MTKKGGVVKAKKHASTHVIDALALLVGFIQPIATIPQIWIVFETQNASSVSFFTWTAYNCASVVLLLYGLHHKLLPIIVAQILWIIVQTVMVATVFIF